jgi:LmbE family N-acetylglucosaminyl deacetylase
MKKKFYYVTFIIAFVFLAGQSAPAQPLNYQPKILLVTAHPDDDALFSATVFKTTRLLDGSVDLALITNGEGGYTYSTLGNYIYGKQLDKEKIGRAQLPGIRKKELMAGGDIVGMRNYFFFDQEDKEYSLDPKVPLASWNTDYILERLQKIIKKEQYDFVFTMMPSEETHAHHKASAILALRAVEALPAEDRPLVLSTTILREKTDTTSFSGLEGYPITQIDRSVAPFTFDRSQKFGNENRLDYNIIANWVIAEHKSQGTMQLLMNAGQVEQYWYYAFNSYDEANKVRTFFKAVNEAAIYTDPNSEE